MKILTKAQTAEFLSQNDNYIILTHRRPDGDTLGSSALLCRGLRSLGKTAISSATRRLRKNTPIYTRV